MTQGDLPPGDSQPGDPQPATLTHHCIPLLSPLRKLRLAFVDVETTGASPKFNDRVTEIGIRTNEAGEVSEDYQQLINPCRPIPQSIVELTGITQAMVDDAPTFDEVEFDIASRLRGSVVIGHNVRFDLGFIKAEFDRLPTHSDRLPTHSDRLPTRFEDLIDTTKVIDTVRLARKAFGRRGNGLQKLAARLNIEVASAHRALADSITTARLFETILAPHGGYDLLLADVVGLQGGACRFFGKSADDPPLPVELEEAIRERHPVRLVFLDTKNNRTERVVVPIEIRTLKKGRCVSAFCTLHQERRTFELGRIVALTRVETLYDDVE